MSQVAQPRGAVDGGARVVAFIAELNLSGVYPDPQPDGRQRRPLQFEGTLHCIAATGEREDEAFALTLLDRPHSAMGGDEIVHRSVQACERGGRLVCVRLP